MSKSRKRVLAALEAASVAYEILDVGQARTAAEAADAVGVVVDQIAKSIIFAGTETGKIYLFLTAGGNRVDPDKASAVAGEALGRADAGKVRSVTGFAIGGVAPVGHLTKPPAFLDPRLMEFDIIWAAAGTPRDVFSVLPADLQRLSDAQLADFTS